MCSSCVHRDVRFQAANSAVADTVTVQMSAVAATTGGFDWLAAAACRDADLTAFFPPVGNTEPAGLALCAVCPVRAQCAVLAGGVTVLDRHGVLAGLTGKERLERKRAGAAKRR